MWTIDYSFTAVFFWSDKIFANKLSLRKEIKRISPLMDVHKGIGALYVSGQAVPTVITSTPPRRVVFAIQP